jgi:hypothetical protein
MLHSAEINKFAILIFEITLIFNYFLVDFVSLHSFLIRPPKHKVQLN